MSGSLCHNMLLNFCQVDKMLIVPYFSWCRCMCILCTYHDKQDSIRKNDSLIFMKLDFNDKLRCKNMILPQLYLYLNTYFRILYLLFLAATKQLYEWYFLSVCLSVCPSVCPSHLFDYVPIIVSSWNFQELSPQTRVTSMQKVKVKGQGHRGHIPT